MAASAPRFSHLRAGDLATLTDGPVTVPVRVKSVKDGNTAVVVPTADRTGYTKNVGLTVHDNLKTQSLTSRTKSGTTLLVFKRTA